jgi:hypothetical protein
MREIQNMAAQGDCIFRRVDRLPKEAKEIPRKGPIIVAHSETGHHHAVDALFVKQYDAPGSSLVSYLVFEDGLQGGGADVVHHRPWDTHETLRLLGNPGTVWEVRRQREWSPEGWRRVED